jgi:hypothetical protein
MRLNNSIRLIHIDFSQSLFSILGRVLGDTKKIKFNQY